MRSAKKPLHKVWVRAANADARVALHGKCGYCGHSLTTYWHAEKRHLLEGDYAYSEKGFVHKRCLRKRQEEYENSLLAGE